MVAMQLAGKKYTKEDILRLVEEEDVEFIRLQFTDMFGCLKNLSLIHIYDCLCVVQTRFCLEKCFFFFLLLYNTI